MAQPAPGRRGQPLSHAPLANTTPGSCVGEILEVEGRLSGLLYLVGAVDPVVFTIAPLVLAGVIAVASYVPA